MKIFTEKKSGIFLKKFKFNIVKSIYIKKESDLKNALEKINFPCVMKIFGKNIIHKKRLKGVELNIKNYKKALKTFHKFKKIKNIEGVVIQPQIKKQNEFLLGLQKTNDFGHVIAFGVGGSDVEKLKKLSFRACPFNKKEALSLINEFFKNLNSKEKKLLIKTILKSCKLSKKFPQIKELDINPLVISNNKVIVLDSRIVFEDKNL
ncbi:acetate--CoA ligase family protein [Nanoarchaeota archaeon]